MWINLFKHFCCLVFEPAAGFHVYLTPGKGTYWTPQAATFTAPPKYVQSAVNLCYCSSTNCIISHKRQHCSNPEASSKLEIVRAPSIYIDLYRRYLHYSCQALGRPSALRAPGRTTNTNRTLTHKRQHCSNPEASSKLEIVRTPSIYIDLYRSYLHYSCQL